MRVSCFASFEGKTTVISKTGLHAIHAMCALAKLPEGEWAGTPSIAEEIGAPRNYLGKLLQTLARQGLVESQKGVRGGFRLALPPASIALIDVVEKIDQVERWSECFLGLPQCSSENPCALHEKWGGLRDGYLALLRDTSIADLL
jgi:Rrf2 family iron-sulfur cluster assembly transcriptional regulator